jgi:hypothetical protein
VQLAQKHRSRGVSWFGLAGVLLTALALICARFPPLCALTGLLAAIALLLAFTGLVRILALRNASLLWPIVGVLGSSCVLMIAATVPGLLGDVYRSFRQKPEPNGVPSTAVTAPARANLAPCRCRDVQ